MVQIKDTQLVRGTLKPTDAKGNPAEVQAGSVKFESSDTEVISVEQNPDSELDVTVKAGRPGGAELRVSFDADLGEGIKTVTIPVAFEVTAGEATGAGISFGAPEEQTAAPADGGSSAGGVTENTNG